MTASSPSLPDVVEAGSDRLGNTNKVFGNLEMFIKVSASETNGHLLIIEHVDSAPGGPPRHIHEDQDEWFYVIEGHYIAEIGDRRYELKAGDSILAPRKVPHVWASTGQGAGRLLIAFQPAGLMQEFFAEASALPGLPPRDELVSLFARHGMTLVGPPLPSCGEGLPRPT